MGELPPSQTAFPFKRINPIITPHDRNSKIWSVIRVSSGNFLEGHLPELSDPESVIPKGQFPLNRKATDVEEERGSRVEAPTILGTVVPMCIRTCQYKVLGMVLPNPPRPTRILSGNDCTKNMHGTAIATTAPTPLLTIGWPLSPTPVIRPMALIQLTWLSKPPGSRPRSVVTPFCNWNASPA